MLAPAMLVLAQALAPPSASAIPGGSAPGAPAASSPVGVTATASKAEVTVGEPFEIVLEATGPAGTEYTFAGEAQADALELRTKALGSEAPAPAPGTHRYDAVVFALGELQIPGIPVRYRLADGTSGEAASAPIPLKVVSLIPKDEADPKLADIRGPASLGIGRAFWIALALLLLLLAALTAWLLRRRRRADAPAAAPVPEIAPDEEALAALEALAREGLPAKGELRPFYIRLSAIAKRYLERRLGAPVLEMTSSETVGFLRAHPHGGELLPVIRDLAEQADRVKFARGEGVVPEAERHLASARALVPALEARLRPAAAEGQEKAA
jgi:cbb3-type cytochrome oxidase subunit 3